MTMSQYLNARYHNSAVTGNGKEMYTMTFSQSLSSLNTNVYLNFNHQTYWDRPASDNWNISTSHYFDIGQVKNISLNLSAYRNRHENGRDDGMYVGLSVPWGRVVVLVTADNSVKDRTVTRRIIVTGLMSGQITVSAQE